MTPNNTEILSMEFESFCKSNTSSCLRFFMSRRSSNPLHPKKLTSFRLVASHEKIKSIIVRYWKKMNNGMGIQRHSNLLMMYSFAHQGFVLHQVPSEPNTQYLAFLEEQYQQHRNSQINVCKCGRELRLSRDISSPSMMIVFG